jgi:hypothetical protein
MTAVPAVKRERDLRLDFFRGLSLWFIFIDHVPRNWMSWLTIRNYGFSDAAEIFVFISGYTAAFVYGRMMREQGFVVAGARILKRAWQLYVAFVFLSVIYIAQIAYVANNFNNPLFAEEMVTMHFLNRPEIVLLEVLRLRFLLANADVLPLYIVLMIAFPVILWLMLRAPTLALLLSIVVWSLAYFGGVNLKLYPTERGWFFNPFGWQLLFAVGAWCAVAGEEWIRKLRESNVVIGLCITYLIVAFAMQTTTWTPRWLDILPEWLIIFPLNKSAMSPLRLAHFLALALVTVHFIQPNAAFLRHPLAQPLILCGKHSLEIFCLGVFLSYTAGFVLIEFSSAPAAQVVVSLAGIALMVGLAALMSWYKALGQRPPRAQPA